jgi:hypothetical protein
MSKPFDPETAENLEDVSALSENAPVSSNTNSGLDGEAVRCQGYANYTFASIPLILTHLAVQHLETYWEILKKVPGSKLRLTKIDDEIHEHFKKEFPDFDPAATIDEDKMKSKEGKEKWRNWINQYEGKINDFNFGTMLRSSPHVEYDRDTTIFGG